MTFREIAYRNFKAQAGKYISYFLCGSFSIMLFFMYTTLLFNDALRQRDENELTSLVFLIGIATVLLFSFFFIAYAHSAFIRSRFREFGIYLTLGMSPGGIRKMIFLENALIILASFAAGLVSGLVFSRIFQMIVLKLLDIGNVPYTLHYESFTFTIAVFAVLFTVVILIGSLSAARLEADEMPKKASETVPDGKGSLLPGVAGILLLLSSFAYLFVLSNHAEVKASIPSLVLYLFLSFSGVYATISSLGKGGLQLLKRNKKLYYKNLPAAAEFSRQFPQYKRLLFVLSVLSSMIIFLVASPFSLMRLSKSIAAIGHSNHLEYAEIEGINRLEPGELQRILDNSATPVVMEKSAGFLASKYSVLPAGLHPQERDIPVISQKTYTEITGASLQIPAGQAVNVIAAWEPGYHGIPPGAELQLLAGKASFRFSVRESVHIPWITSEAAFPSDSGIVLNNADYELLQKQAAPENTGVFHLIRFEDWEKSRSTVEELKKALEKSNSLLPPAERQNSRHFKPSSLLEAYESLKHGYTMFIFVTVFLGLLFFIASGSVLYFKQFNDIAASREKFLRLYRLGITDEEIAGMVRKELLPVFFLPLVFGSILGFSFICFMTNWAGGQSVLGEFLLNAAVVVFLYFIFQGIFYLAAKSKYTEMILSACTE